MLNVTRRVRQSLVQVRAGGTAGAHVQSCGHHTLALPTVEFMTPGAAVYLKNHIKMKQYLLFF